MDYKKIYRNLMLKAKKENRVKSKKMYFEKHHIVPEFMFKNRKRVGPSGHVQGNPNHKDNMVLLTAKEHFISHVLLYKIYKDSHYGYSCASALQFFFSKVINNHPRSENFSCSKRYEIYRMIGLESISKARSGKIPVKDAITGKTIGSVFVNHPKVVSNEWVHITKGRIASEAEKNAIKKRTNGSLNGNYKLVSHSDLLLAAQKSIVDDGYIIMGKFYENFNFKKLKRDKISVIYIKNHFGSTQKFVEFLNSSGIICKYNRFYRSIEQREILATHSTNQLRIRKGITT